MKRTNKEEATRDLQHAYAASIEASARLIKAIIDLNEAGGNALTSVRNLGQAIASEEFTALCQQVRAKERYDQSSPACQNGDHTACVGHRATSTSCACQCHGNASSYDRY